MVVAALLLAMRSGPASAGETLIAVAANFADTAEAIVVLYEGGSGHRVRLASGSTGALYAQIQAGAPFDALLAADVRTPARLEAEGRTVPGSRFVYAIGRLVLWSADPHRIGSDGRAALRDPGLRHLAIANPELAPYGAASRQALERLDLWSALAPRLVLGQNVGQTVALVASGAAEAGLVPDAALVGRVAGERGSRWDVPAELYDPIVQEAVLLRADDGDGSAHDVARDFLEFLRGDAARAVIERFGYRVEPR